MTGRALYLDYNGTTPIDPAVLEAMLPYLREAYGNASSDTPLGRAARGAIEAARGEVAALIGAEPGEITFTSGGTEASNQAIFGLAAIAPAGRRWIVTSTVEHPATDAPCRRLAGQGWEIVRLPVDGEARVELAAAGAAIGPHTAFVTLIHAQNEVGTLEPVADIARLAAAAGAPIHVDASQSLGKLPLDARALGIDALTIAGHKLYAPKGIGALYVRRGLDVPSLLAGAGQEHGHRPGTENVAYIVGLGRAAEIARTRLGGEAARLASLTERLWVRLAASVPGLVRTVPRAPRLPNTLHVLFPEVAGMDVLGAAPELMAATGSACHAGVRKPSEVLLAMGIAPERALGAVRLSLGHPTTEADVDRAADLLAAAWARARGAARAAS